MNDAKTKCPSFREGCPYVVLAPQCKELAGNCPAFKEGCPFKICKTVGEVVEKLAQMRDTSKAKDAYEKVFKALLALNDKEKENLGVPFPLSHVACPFSHDAQGKPIIPK